jgi:hypothetical protein
MKARKIKIRMLQLLAAAGLAASFQNCAPAGKDAAGGGDVTGSREKFVGTTKGVTKVEFGPLVEPESYPQPTTLPSLELDLATGRMNYAMGAKRSSCIVDSARLGTIRDLLAAGKVCTVEPSPDLFHCLLYVAADIKLSAGSDAYLLRPPSCAFRELFLCGDTETELRESLVALAASGCP